MGYWCALHKLQSTKTSLSTLSASSHVTKAATLLALLQELVFHSLAGMAFQLLANVFIFHLYLIRLVYLRVIYILLMHAHLITLQLRFMVKKFKVMQIVSYHQSYMIILNL